MTTEELLEKLNEIQIYKCETSQLELKAARTDCPKRLYDTLSSFSNQDCGGVIIFGVSEDNDFEECGVYDAQDIQKKISEQCRQMEPVVRPLLTVVEKDTKFFVSAEIPGIDIAERPCYYRGQGRLKGSRVRVGDCDEPMTEYEVYSYEAFRKKFQDDVRIVDQAEFSDLDESLLANYISLLRREKPNIGVLNDQKIFRLMGIAKDNHITLSSLLLFCRYPQVYYPQLCITAIVIPGTEYGDTSDRGERFLDNKRIEGNIPDMLEQAIDFVRKNMRTRTIINSETGLREDQTDYPVIAVREAILNALVHRDYSVHTETMPIQIMMFDDRLEIHNPGGIYGRITVDQLGHMQPDTRNPVLVSSLEVMGVTENRYSGIPAIRKAMQTYGLEDPEFKDERGRFSVILSRKEFDADRNNQRAISAWEMRLLAFLKTPKTRQEVVDYMGLKSGSYAMQKYIKPLVARGWIVLGRPETPGSRYQTFMAQPHYSSFDESE